ncbi:MAG: PP2C family protein-serine/threonine phosphatase [Ilumatobacter sp.]
MVTDATNDERRRLLDLQRLLLPQALPPVGCTEVAAGYAAHNEELRLGGDWYDLIDRPDDQVVAIVGDVVGHGIEQIGVMGQLRAAANALGRSCAEPHEVLNHLDAFAQDVPGAAMTTVVVMMLDGSTTGRIASAGHPPVLHVRPGGIASVIEVGRRPPLTLGDGSAVSATFQYDVDDLLVLYTDGLVERRRVPWDDRVKRLGRLVADRFDKSCAEITNDLIDDAVSDGEDDVALMVLRPRNHRAPDHLLRRHDVPNVSIR